MSAAERPSTASSASTRPALSALAVSAVAKAYAGRPVLREVSLQVAAGEAVGLIGVNGAGKTTLLRALLDLTRIDHGSIHIFGTPHHEPVARAGLSYLAERFTPPSYVSGADLLRYLLSLHGRGYDPHAAATEAAALELDAAALAAPARQYSKGMAQKLGLIACILAERPLLVLDEPMSGLDPSARALFKQRLRALKAAGTALFFSTHLLADIEPLCDRIALLDGGRIVFDGTPTALLARTAAADLEQAFLRCLAVDR